MGKMKPSTFLTAILQAAGAATPSVLAAAAANPTRVLVRNTGPILIFLAFDVASLGGPVGPTTNTFRLPAGDEDVFVLAPGQKLYSVGAGVGALASVAVSEAYPSMD